VNEYWWWMIPDVVKFLALMVLIIFFEIRRGIAKEK